MNLTWLRSRLAFASIALATLGTASSCAPDGRIPSERTPSPVTRVEQPVRAAPEREWFLRKLAADVEVPDDGFGLAVGISGITAVVAAPAYLLPAPAGQAVYVFVRSEDGWHQQAKLEPPMDLADRRFGSSIAISGDTLIVGAMPTGAIPGAAYVFVRSGTTWSAPVPLFADDGASDHRFGSSVAIDGDSVVVGAPYATGGGAAYVFSRSGSSFTQTRRLFGSTASLPGKFGQSVAISGTTILVAAPESRTFRGQAHVFTLSGSVWSEQILSIPDLYFQLGSSVALDGNVAVVGSSAHPGFNAAMRMGNRQGAAYLFTKSTSAWTQALTLFANDGEDFDVFGTSVAVSGNTVMVGAPGNPSGVVPRENPANSVYVFDVLAGPAVESRIGSRGDRTDFGVSVALDGDIAVVGTRGAHVAELLVLNGGSCDENLDCQDRHCVSGVCCDTACTGACESCASGTCSRQPHAPGTPPCSPYLCSEASGDCPRDCTVHADCVDTFYCLRSTCVPREPDGESCTVARVCVSGRCIDGECAGNVGIGDPCSSSAECASNHCADGFCCDQPCDGQCEACGERGSRGSCTAVTGAPRGERGACDDYGTVCGSRCDGEHTARCTYSTSACGSSCSDGNQTDSFCDGQGTCVAREPFSCDGLACADDSVCKTSCERFDDCVTGHTCQNGRCEQSATCLDSHTSQRTDGSEEDCTPYLCEAGSCRTSCAEHDDCTDDNVCDVDHRCVTAPPRSDTATNDTGCGCRTTRPRSAQVPWALWALFVVAIRGVSRRVRSRAA